MDLTPEETDAGESVPVARQEPAPVAHPGTKDEEEGPAPQHTPSRILRNMSVLVGGQALGIPITFVTSVFVVRSLGSDGYGDYTLIYAFLGLFIWLTTFGMDDILVRESSRAPRESGEIWGSGIAAAAAFSALAFGLAIAIGIAAGYSSDRIALLVVAGLEVMLMAPPRMLVRFFQVHLEQWRWVVTTLARQTVWLAIVVWIAGRGGQLKTLVIARTALAAIEVVAILALAIPLADSRPAISWKRIRLILKFSFPLALMYLCSSLYYKVDRVVIEKFVGAADLGQYATADNIATFMTIIPMAFMASVYPILCRQAEDRESFDRTTSHAFRVVLILVLGAGGLIFGLATPIVATVYGTEFEFAGRILQMLLVAQVGVAFSAVITTVLTSMGLVRFMTLATAIGAVFNVAANLVVVPLAGVMGAVWVSISSYWIAAALVFSLFSQTRRFSFSGLAVLARLAVPAAVGFGVPQLIDRDSIWAAFLGATIFAGLLILTRQVGKDDLDLLKRALRRPQVPEPIPGAAPRTD